MAGSGRDQVEGRSFVGMMDRESGASHLYFTLTPAPNPFAPNDNPRFFGKVIPVHSDRAYSPPHPVRTDEVDGERRVNRTAGGLGYSRYAPNLCPMEFAVGCPPTRSHGCCHPAPRDACVSYNISGTPAPRGSSTPLTTGGNLADGRFRSPLILSRAERESKDTGAVFR